ncbi:MAG TPA: FecR domain-containing protein, partial [Polyangiaceae bacterium]|nr:FecR domain-containing protein [Polyangiaceae bacterium]
MIDRTPSETFGRAYAAALGTGPSRSTLNAQRAALQGLVARYDQERRAALFRRVAPWAVGGSALAVAAAFALWVRLAPHAVQATLAGRTVAESAELAAREAQELSFSDGSDIVLAPSTRAVLTRATSDRAELRLNEGHLSASIRKKTGITWTIGAGPYSVQVVGTK